MNRRESRQAVPIEAEIGDDRAEPGRRAIAAERLDRVLLRVRQLPGRQRDVVLLRIFEGLSVAETAQVLGCREGTVKVHLHRALAAVRADDKPDVE